MLLDREKLDEQMLNYTDGPVKSSYLLLAHAKLPEGLTVRPHGHGYISRELRFEFSDRWYFSAVLNKSWVLWYFRRPALKGLGKAPHEVASHFPTAELTGQREVKLRLYDETTARAVLGWISENT